MAEIPLTRGMVALVDDADLPLLAPYTWHANKYVRKTRVFWYAEAHLPNSGRRGRKVKMHRVVLPDVPEVDHRNRNGLDNRRENLRPCTRSQNMANQAKARGTSRYKGVYWDTRERKWLVGITFHQRHKYLGRFTDEAAAAKAYNAAALELFGEYASLNVIEAHP